MSARARGQTTKRGTVGEQFRVRRQHRTPPPDGLTESPARVASGRSGTGPAPSPRCAGSRGRARGIQRAAGRGRSQGLRRPGVVRSPRMRRAAATRLQDVERTRRSRAASARQQPSRKRIVQARQRKGDEGRWAYRLTERVALTRISGSVEPGCTQQDGSTMPDRCATPRGSPRRIRRGDVVHTERPGSSLTVGHELGRGRPPGVDRRSLSVDHGNGCGFG